MKKITAFLALSLFAGTAAVSMADPYVYADLRVAPGLHVALGKSPVVQNALRGTVQVVTAPRCAPAPVVVRPSFEKRVVVLSRWEREHRRQVASRYGRNDDRSFGDRDHRGFDRFDGDRGRRD